MTKAKIIGTYQIINTLDQKSYVGSSDNIAKRWRNHTRDLNNGEHHNEPLQRAWTKYGVDAFQFHIIEIAYTGEQALQDEQQLLNALFDGGKTCYNTAPDATAPFRGKKHKQESKDKIGAAHKGKKYSAETCAKIAAAHTGIRRSPEFCAAHSAAMKGKVPWNKGKSKLSRFLQEQPLVLLHSQNE